MTVVWVLAVAPPESLLKTRTPTNARITRTTPIATWSVRRRRGGAAVLNLGRPHESADEWGVELDVSVELLDVSHEMNWEPMSEDELARHCTNVTTVGITAPIVLL